MEERSVADLGADSMDLIGWKRFMEGMILKEIVAVQSKAEVDGRCRMTVDNWSCWR